MEAVLSHDRAARLQDTATLIWGAAERTVIESWRREYNEERPKKALGCMTTLSLCQATCEELRYDQPWTLNRAATESGGMSLHSQSVQGWSSPLTEQW